MSRLGDNGSTFPRVPVAAIQCYLLVASFGLLEHSDALLLDTEALIWWDANDPRLGGKARAAIQDASEVYVSAASAWEIVIKSSLGMLRTTRRPAKAVADGGFRELPVTFEHVEAVRALPRHHADPFDRIIIAAATVEGCTIVSSDEKFTLYHVPLLVARR